MFGLSWREHDLFNEFQPLREVLSDTDLIHPVTLKQVRWGGLEIEPMGDEAGAVCAARDAMMEGKFTIAANIMIQYQHIARLVLPDHEISNYTCGSLAPAEVGVVIIEAGRYPQQIPRRPFVWLQRALEEAHRSIDQQKRLAQPDYNYVGDDEIWHRGIAQVECGICGGVGLHRDTCPEVEH